MENWLLAVVPTLFCGFIMWYISRKFAAQDKKEEEREKARTTNNVLLLKGVSASLALGDATAEALETHRTNGELSRARRQAMEVKDDIATFVMQEGSKNIV